jgi:C4-dicarboxylate-binding protein DctP
MKKTNWVVVLLAVALAVGLVGLLAVGCGGGTEETTTSEVPTTLDPGTAYTGNDAFVVSIGMPVGASLYMTYLGPWMDTIKAASNGRVEFDVKDNNTLVKEAQQIDAVLNGLSDITAFQTGWAPGVYPLLEVGGLPMLFPDTEVAARVVWQLIEEYGQDEYKDFKVLGIMMIHPSNWGGQKAVRLPADLQGLRIRSGDGSETDAINDLGGTPVEVDTSDVQISAQRGLFDGAFLSWQFQGFFLKDWATNFTETNMFCRPILIVMNRQVWDGLPAAVQKAFEDNSGIEQSVKYLADDNAYQLDNSAFPNMPQRGWDRKNMKLVAEAKGGQFITLTADERAQWKTALEPAYQKWVETYASSLPTQEILDRAKELLAQYEDTTATTAAGVTTTLGQ